MKKLTFFGVWVSLQFNWATRKHKERTMVLLQKRLYDTCSIGANNHGGARRVHNSQIGDCIAMRRRSSNQSATSTRNCAIIANLNYFLRHIHSFLKLTPVTEINKANSEESNQQSHSSHIALWFFPIPLNVYDSLGFFKSQKRNLQSVEPVINQLPSGGESIARTEFCSF
jgi:hypothetical protein